MFPWELGSWSPELTAKIPSSCLTRERSCPALYKHWNSFLALFQVPYLSEFKSSSIYAHVFSVTQTSYQTVLITRRILGRSPYMFLWGTQQIEQEEDRGGSALLWDLQLQPFACRDWDDSFVKINLCISYYCLCFVHSLGPHNNFHENLICQIYPLPCTSQLSWSSLYWIKDILCINNILTMLNH